MLYPNTKFVIAPASAALYVVRRELANMPDVIAGEFDGMGRFISNNGRVFQVDHNNRAYEIGAAHYTH